jgi:hypothetical protein
VCWGLLQAAASSARAAVTVSSYSRDHRPARELGWLHAFGGWRRRIPEWSEGFGFFGWVLVILGVFICAMDACFLGWFRAAVLWQHRHSRLCFGCGWPPAQAVGATRVPKLCTRGLGFGGLAPASQHSGGSGKGAFPERWFIAGACVQCRAASARKAVPWPGAPAWAAGRRGPRLCAAPTAESKRPEPPRPTAAVVLLPVILPPPRPGARRGHGLTRDAPKIQLMRVPHAFRKTNLCDSSNFALLLFIPFKTLPTPILF